MVRRPCYLCGSQRHHTVAKQVFQDPYLALIGDDLNEQPREIVVCQDCGLTFHAPTLTAIEIRTLYERYRDSSFRGESSDQYFDRITTLPPEQSFNYQKVQKLNSILSQRLPPKPLWCIYDVGAGGGVFLKTFLDHARGRWEACGVEPTVAYAELAARRLGITVHPTMYRPGLFDRQFDLMTVIKVLEHASDPVQFMKDVFCDLYDDGLVYLEVPSVREVATLPSDHDQLTYTHLHFYSSKTLPYVLDRAGFELISLEEIPNSGGDWDLVAMLRKRIGPARTWSFPLQDYREIVALRPGHSGSGESTTTTTSP